MNELISVLTLHIYRYCDMISKSKLLLTEKLEKKEKGFNLSALQSVKLNEYNALYDPNMRHFFESKINQNLLYKTGQIDSHGRVIDYEKNKSKLHILEREFKEAERVEEKRQLEEKEMRVSTVALNKPNELLLTMNCSCWICFSIYSIECSESDSTNWRRQRKLKY